MAFLKLATAFLLAVSSSATPSGHHHEEPDWQILVGGQNTTVKPALISGNGKLNGGRGTVDITDISERITKVSINTTYDFVGARFTANESERFFGVWEYPWSGSLDNAGISYDFKGIGNSKGVHWANARAPFFFSDAGWAVYADTLTMGSFNFSVPVHPQFIFNTSSLVYYIIKSDRKNEHGIKGILEDYAKISNTIGMPPDSSFGPTFWSDDFTQDFHEGVTNAEENYYDVVNHLYDNQIHATAMFADRPYGTGNYSYGNFDFDPVFYPNPQEFIANLSSWGFDFQVWAANRAFYQTELFNTSDENGWLFPGIDPIFFRGPALNLSIPEAYEYFKQRLEYFPSIGVKGYKIDRGEEEEMPEKWGENVFYNFARSVVDRSRSTTAVWNGDSWANFTGLSYSVASGIRSGLIGFSQWGSDTGGYIRKSADPNEAVPSEEVWARWMWFSAFSPVYEIMIGTNHTPWYPPYTNDLVQVLKQTTDVHHELLPTIKSYTYQAHKTGLPVMRAAFLEAQNDPKAFEINDAYFFGEDLYTAPIVTAGGERSIYFPNTGRKYLEYFEKKELYEAGTTTSVSIDTNTTPAYILEGGIIVKGDILQGNNKWTEDWKPSLTIEIYPSPKVRTKQSSYYTGSKEVLIKAHTDARARHVKVEYGALEVAGTIVLFTKDGNRTVELCAEGGTASFEDVTSLFDE
ncbi:glycoside hydrolase family 31 protein [Pseudocercospora fijiensis CIRAD86]|uniref:Glycoside hydrolase family 31 protein n=1 Tax=Pseudocercospora fijiensis (strain CIRAD86) TaxID=383855 RepID=M2YN91_PSEFD|nr:glycoside hydrolase family 31 protein [Pseudocercospora fijiensis CIRAD86]EME79180.1 glycoside hydrolase family 31 protein [Pseudocercospora fijiensis CIRAD86]